MGQVDPSVKRKEATKIYRESGDSRRRASILTDACLNSVVFALILSQAIHDVHRTGSHFFCCTHLGLLILRLYG